MWTAPAAGWVKINVDLCFQTTTKIIGGRIIIRYNFGQWIVGIVENLGEGKWETFCLLNEFCDINHNPSTPLTSVVCSSSAHPPTRRSVPPSVLSPLFQLLLHLLVTRKVAMGANNIPLSALDKEQIFGMAEKEMEYRVELFNKMTQTCFKKCVDNKYRENELNMGENSCIDRCVSKYWHVTNLIGQLLGTGKPPM
ncbi:hypothetical protein RIF29_27840 [Crotalaria pallida]|uniref:Tim10-like domain-containing protein n=2 Tax=Crotalaria pallida TaxID=3830 RepID=A0AAN9ES67_CROPI